MKITMKRCVAITAAAIAQCAAVPASAAYFEPWTEATTPGATRIHMSGSTSQDKGLVLLMRRICSPGSMTRVLRSTIGQPTGGEQSVTLCEANGAQSLPIPAGTKLVLYKNSDGGSGTGVKPVANNTTLPFLNLASLTVVQYGTPATCTVTTVAATPDFSNFKEYNCKTNILTAAVVPDAGISDVEPNKLGWVNNVNGPLTVAAGPQIIFGVPVSKNFRDALQTAQGKPAGSDLEVNMPSLTKAQLGSIYNGALIPVNRLSDMNGNALAPPSGSTTFQVCRRKGDTPAAPGGSGTLVAFSMYFLNVPCFSNKDMTAGVNGDPWAPAFPPPPNRVISYSGTTGVLGCLNAQHVANKYAVGMASTENIPGSAYAGDAAWGTDDPGNWRFIKVFSNAIAPPTLCSTAANIPHPTYGYDLFYEGHYMYRPAGSTYGPTLTASQLALFNRIVADNASPTVIKQLNTRFVQTFGNAGLLALPSAGAEGGSISANPINAWTRTLGGNPNSCQPPNFAGVYSPPFICP